ncbi:hypothetical protein ACWF2L_03185 [Streptomyces anulatus]
MSGTGADGDPYQVSAAVILDPAPPGGGDQLLQSGPDGLFLECEQVRGCISAGDGAAYDPATGVIEARLSTDADNAVTFGTDGGLYAPTAAGGATELDGVDSTSVDVTVTGTGVAGDPYEVTAAVILDPVPPGGGTNLMQSGPDGLYLECEQVRGCLVAGDGIEYDPATGEIAATPAPTALAVTDSATVDLTLSGDGSAGTPYEVTAAVILDPAPPGGGSNLVQSGPDGLFLECEQVRGCVSAGDGAAYDEATGVISARPSTDAGNALAFGTDGGLLVPPGGGDATVVEAGDSTTVDNEVTGTGTVADPYVVTSSVILDPAPPGGGTNLVQAGPDGLYLECEQVRGCLVAGDGIDYDPATGEIAALPVPTALEVTDSATVDLALSGDGSAGTPYEVTAAVILDPAPPGGGDQLLQSGPDGLFLECEQVRGCISAGDGAEYDPATGVVAARPSTDAGNTLAFGTDGGLLVPEASALDVGCGLQGAGTAASPLAAFPIAGEQPWADDWDCDAAANSTLKCDPNTGALWTPPEHTTAALTLQQNHPMGTPVMPATGTVVVIDGDAWSEGAYDADTLTQCRGISFSAEFTGHAEISWTAGAIFDLAYAIGIGGGSLASRLMYSELTPSGPAGRRRVTFSTAQATVLAPHTGYVVRVYPAIRVTTGSVTIHQWITDTHLFALTR